MIQEVILESGYTEVSDTAVMALTPLVSVMMLTYKHGPFLSDAIEGVIAQKSDFPIELIIGEDCSPDNTREIALAYQQRYPQLIRVMYSDQNVGMHKNCWKTLNACRGKFIAFCEGDDYWIDPHKLQKQVEAFCDDSTVGVVTDNLRRIGDQIIPNDVAVEIDHLGFVKIIGLLHSNTIKTATVMYKIEVVNKIFSEELLKFDWPFGDYTMHLTALTMGKVKFLNDVTAVYRLSLGSATRTSTMKSLHIARSALQCSLYFSKINMIDPKIIQSIEMRNLAGIYGLVYATCDRKEFIMISQRLKEIGFKHNNLVRHLIRRIIVGSVLQTVYIRFKNTLDLL